MIEQHFHLTLMGLGFIGFLASIYTVVHTGRRSALHKAMIILDAFFIGVFMYGALSWTTGHTPRMSVGAAMFGVSLVTIFAVWVALDHFLEHLFRRNEICRKKETDQIEKELDAR